MKPKRLKIMGKEFSVRFVHPVGLSESAAGRVVCDYQTIVIDATNHPQRQKEVLLHEVIHVYDFLLCIGLDESNTGRLAHAMYEFLRRNKKVARWIMKNKKGDRK